MSDPISPDHYRHPSGVECIEITRHQSFTLGNAIKYVWRAGMKDHVKQDLLKAVQYLDWAIEDKARFVESPATERFIEFCRGHWGCVTRNDLVLLGFIYSHQLEPFRADIQRWAETS